MMSGQIVTMTIVAGVTANADAANLRHEWACRRLPGLQPCSTRIALVTSRGGYVATVAAGTLRSGISYQFELKVRAADTNDARVSNTATVTVTTQDDVPPSVSIRRADGSESSRMSASRALRLAGFVDQARSVDSGFFPKWYAPF